MPTELKEAKIIVRIETKQDEEKVTRLEDRVKDQRREVDRRERQQERERRETGRERRRGGSGTGGVAAGVAAARSRVFGTIAAGAGVAVVADMVEPIVKGVLRAAGIDTNSVAWKLLGILPEHAIDGFRWLVDNVAVLREAAGQAAAIQAAASLTGGDVDPVALGQDFVALQRIASALRQSERARRNLHKELLSEGISEQIGDAIQRAFLGNSVGK